MPDDLTGNPNFPASYSQQADLDAPTVSIKGPKRVQPAGFWLTIVFSEPVTGFEQSDVAVGNGAVKKFSLRAGRLPGQGQGGEPAAR